MTSSQDYLQHYLQLHSEKEGKATAKLTQIILDNRQVHNAKTQAFSSNL